MRFFLDECVDVGVCNVFKDAYHECWTVHDARRESLDDDEQSVYADDKGAAIITHDREFTQRRKGRTFGCHVFLDCDHPQAIEMVRQGLPELVQMIEKFGEGVYTMDQKGTVYERGNPI